MTGYHALVLAAGAASRFGGKKMLAEWNGRALVATATEIALLAPVASVTVVLGCDAAAVANALKPLAGPGLRVTQCENWATGISASLRAGIRALPSDARGAVIFLGDMPRVPPGLAGQLLTALDEGAPAAVAVFRGAPAHPVAFARELFAGLCALTGERGARSLLETLGGVVRVDNDDRGSVFDVDTSRDHLALLSITLEH